MITRLNANQVFAMAKLHEENEDLFYFNIVGTDPLDNRVIQIHAVSFDMQTILHFDIDENGTAFNHGEAAESL